MARAMHPPTRSRRSRTASLSSAPVAMLLMLAGAAAAAANPTSSSVNAHSTRVRTSQHPAVLQSSASGAAKLARQSLLKQRTEVLGTVPRRGAATVTSRTHSPAKTIVTPSSIPK